MSPPPATRAAFVTGASAGIGRAIAERLLREGFAVWGTARDVARLADPFGDRAGFHAVGLDLAEPEAAVMAFERALAATPAGFALVVNNAGHGVFAPFAATDFDVWRRQIEAMLLGTAGLVHRQLRDLQHRPGGGTLVNVASLATEFPLPFMAGYNIAKAGLSALSESLLIETAGSRVTVIDFRPGDYRTTFNQSMQRPLTAADARQTAAWQALATHLANAPRPERAAADLWRAVQRGRSGVVRSGSWFQIRLAPWFQRLVPLALARAVRWRYFGLR